MMQESLALTATLNQLAELDRYNHWVYEQIADALGQRVLEVGSGTGNITQFLCADGRDVIATDIIPSYRRELEKQFGKKANVRVDKFDLTTGAPEEFIREPFDTVVCLNVLEHVENDLFALEQMRRVLKPGGKLGLLVPSHQFLYGEVDRAVGHYRRYEKRALTARLKEAGYLVQSMKSFSFVAVLPWLINGRLFKRDYLPAGQANLANRLVPFLKLERLIGPPFGLSLVAIAQKK
ncbi:MAG TPA: class I SAM-dependent methyltransferase [Blastocatellia bacterium]|nr:class I SAM-dependent methyltransferase [Blastocatellia bacterium]